MSKVKVFSRYDLPDEVFAPLESGSEVDKDSAVYTDINYIVNRYVSTHGQSGMPVNSHKPIFGDFSKSFTVNDVFALKDSMQVLYDELTPDSRKQFKNFNDFLAKVGSGTDEDVAKYFSPSVTHLGEPDAGSTAGASAPVETPGKVNNQVLDTAASSGT